MPGNDGTWFLKAVGVETTPTTLGDVAAAADSTGEMVQELWNADAPPGSAPSEGDAFQDWAPEELSKTIGKDRRFRWSVVIPVALLAIAFGVVAWYLPRTSAPRAQARSEEYRAAMVTLRTDLPNAQAVLAELTEPTADASQFPELIPTVADLRADADAALDVAARALPEPWPLASTAPFKALELGREAVSRDATVAQSIARRLADLLDYRTLVPGFLETGDLPAGGGVDLNELNTRLATVSADSATLITELPADAAFADHIALAQSTLDWFLVWQIDYVDALRNDDTAAVSRLLAELEERRATLDQALVSALAQIRSEVDADIIGLAASLDGAIIALPTT